MPASPKLLTTLPGLELVSSHLVERTSVPDTRQEELTRVLAQMIDSQ